MQGKTLTPNQIGLFIKKLKSTNGNVSKACQSIYISRSAVYEHREKNPDFKKLWDDVQDGIADEMEAEVFRRAVKGTLKPVFYMGEKVGAIREYSDALLQFGLKGKRPDIYRERIDMNQTVTGNLDVDLEAEVDHIFHDDE